MDEPSLSEHEQRILQEIERSLAQDDPDIERRLRNVDPRRDRRLMRLGFVGLIAGLLIMVGFVAANRVLGGAVGFLVMLGSTVLILTAMKQMSVSSPARAARGAWRKAEDRMRPRRKDT
ncbi:MAG TPA: DUF3040 domain-containing protein [Actinomycetota bacterium]|nr:DUF3040 domain-containing protein [Actinomycetota bacterium]